MTAAKTIPLTLVEIAEAQALARQGVFVDEIADRLTTTVDAVNDAIAGKLGPHAALYEATPQRRLSPLSPAEIQSIARLSALGVSSEEICDLFSITRGRLDLVLSEARRAKARMLRLRQVREAELSDDIERRDMDSAPDTEPAMRDLLRVPMPASGTH